MNFQKAFRLYIYANSFFSYDLSIGGCCFVVSRCSVGAGFDAELFLEMSTECDL